MDSEQILKGINDEDVIHISGVFKKRTFCISEFRTMVKTAAVAMKNAYGRSLQEQGHHLYPKGAGTHIYDAWLTDSGIECELLRLGDSQWKHGKVRIRIEAEFIPDDEDDDASNESSLDEFRENS
jgi:hypothetical protein